MKFESILFWYILYALCEFYVSAHCQYLSFYMQYSFPLARLWEKSQKGFFTTGSQGQGSCRHLTRAHCPLPVTVCYVLVLQMLCSSLNLSIMILVELTQALQAFTSRINRTFSRTGAEISLEVGQECVLNTFDLGGCVEALPWSGSTQRSTRSLWALVLATGI